MSAELETAYAGAAVVDITPPPGLMMCGYAARSEPALGAHDALTARALVIGDTALVVADVLGLHEETCAAIRRRSGFSDDRVVVVATHTHGAPMPMPGRGGGDVDSAFLRQLEDGCVEAIHQAAARRRPARLASGNGPDPGVAFNRRATGGPIDPNVPVLRVDAIDGTPIAVAFAHALHPVVLGAGNRLYTADFPHFARQAVERAVPGAVALFLPGCSGDVSTGHSAASSVSTETPPDRTYAEAERIGGLLAASVLGAGLTTLHGDVGARTRPIELALKQREVDLDTLATLWREQARTADAAWATLYRHWAVWAETTAREPLAAWSGRVTAFTWGGLKLVFLPGEVFANTAIAIRAGLAGAPTPFVISLSDGVPGYIPDLEAYAQGGYEVEEAHRYYGMPGAFAEGSAEVLGRAAIDAGRPVGAAPPTPPASAAPPEPDMASS